MNLFKQTLTLVKKDLQLEWRQKYAISGILLYLVSIIFIIYLSFEDIAPNTWNVLLWIILLFTAVNAIAKSFVQESVSRLLYYYSIASPHAIILAKIIYNILVMVFLAGMGLGLYALFAGFPVIDYASFFSALAAGSVAFAMIFSMISAIAAKAGNTSTLMAILSFPLVLPVLKILLTVSNNSLLINDFAGNLAAILTLAALDILIMGMALLLFPYLWRD